jgi:hypothetical protein
LDWVKISISKEGVEEVETQFSIDKDHLAKLGVILFHLACTQRVGVGWDADAIIGLLRAQGANLKELGILAANLSLMQRTIEEDAKIASFPVQEIEA